MYNGTLDTSDVLLNRGLNGAYGIGAGLGLVANGNFAGDGSAVKEAVRGNRDLDLLESVNRGTSDQFLSQKITDGNAALTSTVNMNNQFLSEQMRERSIADNFAATQRQLFQIQSENQREFRAMDVKLTECCCKLEAGQASIQAKLDSQALAASQAENQRLQIELALANRSPGNSGN